MNPFGELSVEDQSRMVAGLVARMSAVNRQTIVLIHEDEMTYAEAAARLEVSVRTVESRIHRAVRQLRKELCP